MGRTKHTQMTPSTLRPQGEVQSSSIRSFLQTPAFLPRSTRHHKRLLPLRAPHFLERNPQQRPTPETLLEEVKLTLQTEMATLRTSLSALKNRGTGLEFAGPEASCSALPITVQHTRLHIDILKTLTTEAADIISG
ncbi:Hypothetical predicted protein, partial [Pelobates cultripes]